MQSYKDFEVGKQYKFTGGDAIYTCIAKTPTGRPVLHYVYTNNIEELVFIPHIDRIFNYIEYIPEKWVNLYWNQNKTYLVSGDIRSSKEEAKRINNEVTSYSYCGTFKLP